MLSQAPESTVAVMMGWCTTAPFLVSPPGNPEKLGFNLNLGPVMLLTCCLMFSELSVGLTPGKSAPENPDPDRNATGLALGLGVPGFLGALCSNLPWQRPDSWHRVRPEAPWP